LTTTLLVASFLNHGVGGMLTDEMRDCSKQELIDYHIVLLNEACAFMSRFLHVRHVGSKNTKGVGLCESFVQMTIGLFYFLSSFLFLLSPFFIFFFLYNFLQMKISSASSFYI
jgi:hypothetical protein